LVFLRPGIETNVVNQGDKRLFELVELAEQVDRHLSFISKC
jgi:hypothetical protein